MHFFKDVATTDKAMILIVAAIKQFRKVDMNGYIHNAGKVTIAVMERDAGAKLTNKKWSPWMR